MPKAAKQKAGSHAIKQLPDGDPGSFVVTGGFWRSVLSRNAQVTIPDQFSKLESSGRLGAMQAAWRPTGDQEPHHIFWDSDVYKWLEAAALTLAQQPGDQKILQQIDKAVRSIEALQLPDGYINSYFTHRAPDQKWRNLRDDHELYCAGHLIEAAVALSRFGKDDRLITVCRKLIAHIEKKFGHLEGQIAGYPGHQEIELALIKYYRHTGDQNAFALAQFFIDERGAKPHYFDIEAIARGDHPKDYWARTHAYTQSDIPVREQSQPTGHAVRGGYLYAAMVDLAAETGDAALLNAASTIWENIVNERLYITGGIGSSRSNEGHTQPFDLPNESAYAETCAGIALLLLSQRLLRIEHDGRYADLIERILYNNLLAGVSLAGDRYFYVNPLACEAGHERWPWLHCVCCPPNVARILASFGSLMHTPLDNGCMIHQYAHGELNCPGYRLRLKSDYPWDGSVGISISLDNASSESFPIALRIPGWCENANISVNGQAVNTGNSIKKGYLWLDRHWKDGDHIQLDLPMPVEQIEADTRVSADVGRIALMRGPIVYCLEEIDNRKGLSEHLLPLKPTFGLQDIFMSEQRMIALHTRGVVEKKPQNHSLYRRRSPAELEPVDIVAVPYFAWSNRTAGEMLVWIRTLIGTEAEDQDIE